MPYDIIVVTMNFRLHILGNINVYTLYVLNSQKYFFFFSSLSPATLLPYSEPPDLISCVVTRGQAATRAHACVKKGEEKNRYSITFVLVDYT